MTTASLEDISRCTRLVAPPATTEIVGYDDDVDSEELIFGEAEGLVGNATAGGSKIYLPFTIYPGTGLPYVYLSFRPDSPTDDPEDSYWPEGSYEILDANGDLVLPTEPQTVTAATDFSVAVDPSAMPAGNYGGTLSATRTPDTSLPLPALSGNVGACCLPDGTCSVSSERNCVAAGGVYKGDGVSCSSITCSEFSATKPVSVAVTQDDPLQIAFDSTADIVKTIYQGDTDADQTFGIKRLSGTEDLYYRIRAAQSYQQEAEKKLPASAVITIYSGVNVREPNVIYGPMTSETLSLNMDTTDLVEGNYDITLMLAGYCDAQGVVLANAVTKVLTIRVLKASTAISVNPGSLEYSIAPSGSLAKTLTITNMSSSVKLIWSAAELTVDTELIDKIAIVPDENTTGIAASGTEDVVVTVTAPAESGTYHATIRFTTGTEFVDIPITVVVADPLAGVPYFLLETTPVCPTRGSTFSLTITAMQNESVLTTYNAGIVLSFASEGDDEMSGTGSHSADFSSGIMTVTGLSITGGTGAAVCMIKATEYLGTTFGAVQKMMGTGFLIQLGPFASSGELDPVTPVADAFIGSDLTSNYRVRQDILPGTICDTAGINQVVIPCDNDVNTYTVPLRIIAPDDDTYAPAGTLTVAVERKSGGGASSAHIVDFPATSANWSGGIANVLVSFHDNTNPVVLDSGYVDKWTVTDTATGRVGYFYTNYVRSKITVAGSFAYDSSLDDEGQTLMLVGSIDWGSRPLVLQSKRRQYAEWEWSDTYGTFIRTSPDTDVDSDDGLAWENDANVHTLTWTFPNDGAEGVTPTGTSNTGWTSGSKTVSIFGWGNIAGSGGTGRTSVAAADETGEFRIHSTTFHEAAEYATAKFVNGSTFSEFVMRRGLKFTPGFYEHFHTINMAASITSAAPGLVDARGGFGWEDAGAYYACQSIGNAWAITRHPPNSTTNITVIMKSFTNGSYKHSAREAEGHYIYIKYLNLTDCNGSDGVSKTGPENNRSPCGTGALGTTAVIDLAADEWVISPL